VTKSKTRLKRRNKIIPGDVIGHHGHLHKHNVLKSLCEDRKDGNRVIARFLCRGINFWKWNDIGNLQTKDMNVQAYKDKARVKQLRKHSVISQKRIAMSSFIYLIKLVSGLNMISASINKYTLRKNVLFFDGIQVQYRKSVEYVTFSRTKKNVKSMFYFI
jgi:hypothetical protein